MGYDIFHDCVHLKVSSDSVPDQILILEETVSSVNYFIFSWSKFAILISRPVWLDKAQIDAMILQELLLNVLSDLLLSLSIIIPSREKLAFLKAFDFKLFRLVNFPIFQRWHCAINLFERQ